MLSPLITDLTNKNFHTIIIASVAIFSEKTGEYIISRWKIDVWFTALFMTIKSVANNIIGLSRVFSNFLSTIIGIGIIYYALNYELSDTIRMLLVVVGIGLIFSKDTLLRKIWGFIDKTKNE